jgi:carboxyl-terminal processing protease
MHFLRLSLLFALVGFAVFAPAQTVDGKPAVKAEVLGKVTEIVTNYAFVPKVDFKKWPDFLAAEKPKLEAAKTDDEFTSAVNGALSKFGLSHIVLQSPRNVTMRRTATSTGIGVSTYPHKDGLLIMRVVDGAPADKVGLIAGDIIIGVNGKKPEGITGIPGEAGTSVAIKVRRATGEEVEYNIVRKPFSTRRPEVLETVSEDTKRLSVYTFDLQYDAKRVDELMSKAMDSKNLILDLRDNGGGAVVNLQHLLGYFLPADEPIGTFIGKQTINKYVAETGLDGTDLVAIAKWQKRKLMPLAPENGKVFKGNVIVLVNGGSGSASEMCAAALRERLGAKVVGRPSAGAVLVSVIMPVGDGFSLQYPLSDYITIQGVRLEGNGVKPDVIVEDAPARLPGQPDLTLLKAVELTKTG